RAVVVEADEHPDHDVRREADEPGRAVFIGRAGLAPDPAAEAPGAGGGAALDHAFQHGADLIGGDRVDDLLADRLEARRFLAAERPVASAAGAVVGAEDGLAVPVLHHLDQIGVDLAAA